MLIMGSILTKQERKLTSSQITDEDLHSKVLIDSTSLHCPICMEIFPSIPLILSCGHSFCELCLGQIVKFAPTNDRYALDCPTCRIVTCLPLASSESTLCEKWIKKVDLSKVLPKNYLMENIFDNLKIVSQKVEPFIYLDETINITNQRLTAELRLIQQKVDKLNKRSTENNSFLWQVIAMLLGALLIKQMYDQYP